MKYQLGNYVTERSKPGQILTVSEIDLKNMCVIEGYALNEETAKQARIIPVEMVEPIPLDAEWLIKFGFVRFNNSETAYRHPVSLLMLELEKGVCAFKYGNETLAAFKFVHSLQNLYFCLENKELLCKDTRTPNT